jgi:hypothetical protein
VTFLCSNGVSILQGWNRSWWVYYMERIVISDAAVVAGAKCS